MITLGRPTTPASHAGSPASLRLAPMRSRQLVGVTLLVVLGLLMASLASAKPQTRVLINSHPTPVYFNDGDSFTVLEGPLKDTKTRLSGFNTLESFGPAHRWGT